MDYKMDLKPPVEVRYRKELEALEEDQDGTGSGQETSGGL